MDHGMSTCTCTVCIDVQYNLLQSPTGQMCHMSITLYVHVYWIQQHPHTVYKLCAKPKTIAKCWYTAVHVPVVVQFYPWFEQF